MAAAPLAALQRHAVDAVSFQALKHGMRWWQDDEPPDGSGALLGYYPCGGSWIAVGTPLVDPERRADAVRRFMTAARRAHRRAVFFGVEDVTPFRGARFLPIGVQSVLKPAHWPAVLRERRRLREQLRRARAKGVTVREVTAAEIAEGRPLRAEVERLRRDWLESRAMEPLAFLVSVEPFHAAPEHLYFVADRGGRAVQFLSAVPIYARQGWLMEDMLRGADAPNGTTELVIDALMRRLGGDPYWVTPGLTPLMGAVPWWLHVTRVASVALYDFSGLWRFRSRLRPDRWCPVWLVWDRGPSPLVLLDVLRAFSDGRLLRFASRSLLLHPNGPPWLVAVPLVGWTILLAALVLTGHAAALGYSSAALRMWVGFDAMLAWLLFAVAHRPRRGSLAIAGALAAFDAVVSSRHLAVVGLGRTLVPALLRIVATAGPIVGTSALAWAAWRAHVRRRLAAR